MERKERVVKESTGVDRLYAGMGDGRCATMTQRSASRRRRRESRATRTLTGCAGAGQYAGTMGSGGVGRGTRRVEKKVTPREMARSVCRQKKRKGDGNHMLYKHFQKEKAVSLGGLAIESDPGAKPGTGVNGSAAGQDAKTLALRRKVEADVDEASRFSTRNIHVIGCLGELKLIR